MSRVSSHGGILIGLMAAWRRLSGRKMRKALAPLLGQLTLAWAYQMVRRSNERGEGPPTLVGFFDESSGIALSAQLASQALDRLGLEHRRWNLTNYYPPADIATLSSSAWIFFLNPPELMQLLVRWGPVRTKGLRYGYWAWELPQAPKGWLKASRAVDGVIAPSRFTAQAFDKCHAPVSVTPHPVNLLEFDCAKWRAPRPNGEAFRVVGLFDARSSFTRKNPIAALKAFKLAFGDDSAARLIFKIQNGSEAPALMAILRERGGPNVEFVDGTWPRKQVLGFIASADALLSLHRSEGFGLPLAEAMLLGIPVVATAWSGNLDFMDDRCSCLTPARLVPIDDPQGIYRAGYWAEADVEAAAAYLRRLKADPDFAAEITAQAKGRMMHQLSPEAWFDSLPQELRAAFSVLQPVTN